MLPTFVSHLKLMMMIICSHTVPAEDAVMQSGGGREGGWMKKTRKTSVEFKLIDGGLNWREYCGRLFLSCCRRLGGGSSGGSRTRLKIDH